MCQQQQVPPQFLPRLWKCFINHCLSNHFLLLQNVATARQPHTLQEGNPECQQFNSWPQKRSGLQKQSNKINFKKVIFLDLGFRHSAAK